MGEIVPTPEETLGDLIDDNCDGTALVSTDVLVRYVINEPASGQTPTELMDVAPDPLALPITFANGLAFTQDTNGHRGLTWPARGQDGRAARSIQNTKVTTRLDQAQRLTLELVADVTDSDSGSTLTRLFYLGINESTDQLSLIPRNAGENLRLYFNDNNADAHNGVQWPVNLHTAGRIVLHVVLDTTKATDSERVTLYRNGSALSPEGTPTWPGENERLNLTGTNSLALGNRPSGGRSIQGTLHYAAVYMRALTPNEVESNAAVLLANDDNHTVDN
ncbi:LamG-like jellyroll fold domain-containing protein [Chondromyces crocatus]|uniref:LamG-like jellyroll fold domain-containing protein n=1 Tax=Chondromyces crocatus TaxID=52 RepID=UPI00067B78FC|nr:hypothetical protein [Chondromyces crocatus]